MQDEPFTTSYLVVKDMTKELIEKQLLAFRGAEGSYPFGPEALVFKVKGKMFALVSQHEDPARVTLKCDPVDGAHLVRQYESIIPGYHMNKKHWITINLDGGVPAELLQTLMDESYRLVVSKLTKKERQSLEDL